MGILDKAKGALGKAHEMAEEHADQLKAGIDKAETLANKATKGKFADRIEAMGDKAAGMVPTKAEEEGGAEEDVAPDEPGAHS